MGIELEKNFDFRNFNKNEEKKEIVEKKVLLTKELIKPIKFASFFIIGSLLVGVGLSIGNGFVQSYLIEKQNLANIKEIQIKNEEIRKNNESVINAKNNALKDEIEINESNKKKQEESKLLLNQTRGEYNVWVKNKSAIIANYESQLILYDKAYQDANKGVKDGFVSLTQLSEVRGLYQDYRKYINSWIVYINEATKSFDTFNNLNDEEKTALKEELVKYQTGSLNRNSELEAALISAFDINDDDSEDKTYRSNKKNSRNKMIDTITDLLKSDNQTTKYKKLKM